MADPKAVLEALARCIGQTRGLGQTTAAVAVAAGATVGARYVVADRNHADFLRGTVPQAEGLAAVVALHNLPNDTRGHHMPYVVDHHAVAVAAADGVREIERLRAELTTEKDRSARWEALFDGRMEEVRKLRANLPVSDAFPPEPFPVAETQTGTVVVDNRVPRLKGESFSAWALRREAAFRAWGWEPGIPVPIAVRVPAPGWDELDEAERGAEVGAPRPEAEGAVVAFAREFASRCPTCLGPADKHRFGPPCPPVQPWPQPRFHETQQNARKLIEMACSALGIPVPRPPGASPTKPPPQGAGGEG